MDERMMRPQRVLPYGEAKRFLLERSLQQLTVQCPHVRPKALKRLAHQIVNQNLPKGASLTIEYRPANWFERVKERLHMGKVRYVECQ